MLTRRLFLTATGGALAARALAFTVNPEPVPASLDHIILGVSDLDRGIEYIAQGIGVRPILGGVHPGRGTRNALLALGGQRYLEIMAPDPKQPADSEKRGLHKLTEPRILGWASHLATAQVIADRLKQAGLAFTGPTPGSRKRPDGRVLNWKTIELKDDFSGLLPFFIEWGAGSPHPSADSPQGVRLTRFIAYTPKNEDLVRLTGKIELDLPINKDGDKTQLRATLTRGKSEFVITS
jgi:hypothetical protein